MPKREVGNAPKRGPTPWGIVDDPPAPRQRARDLFVRYGLRAKDIARATGASVRTVKRWVSAAATAPRRTSPHDEGLDRLFEVIEILEVDLAPEWIGRWLTKRNNYVNGERPIEVLADPRRFHEVRQAAIDSVNERPPRTRSRAPAARRKSQGKTINKPPKAIPDGTG